MQRQIFHDILVQKIIFKGMGLATLSSGKKMLIKGNVLPNSIVDVAVLQKKKDFFITELLCTKSYDKDDIAIQDPPCPHYVNPLQQGQKGCWGCKRQVIPYTKQLEIKESIVFDSFRLYPQLLRNTYITPIAAAPEPFHYRNKVELSFGINPQGENTVWFHETGSFEAITDIQSCYIISKKANEVFQSTKKVIENGWIKAYNQKDHTGTLRHLVIREGINTGQILINIVYADKNWWDTEENIRQTMLHTLQHNEYLTKTVTTLVTTRNNGLGEAIPYDSPNIVIRWEGHIYEELNMTSEDNIHKTEEQNMMIIEQGSAKEIKVKKKEHNKKEAIKIICKISPTSFFQTNTKAAEWLLQKVTQYMPSQKWTLLDLYCGTGSIGLSLLKQGMADYVIGIELMQWAIEDAKHNAYINKLEDKVYFTAWKAEELLYKDEHIRSVRETIKTIVVDPPRAWLHKKVINFLSWLKLTLDYTLLYISCNPVTLARDLHELHKQGFKITSLQTVDLFPQTYHVETIAILK